MHLITFTHIFTITKGKRNRMRKRNEMHQNPPKLKKKFYTRNASNDDKDESTFLALQNTPIALTKTYKQKLNLTTRSRSVTSAIPRSAIKQAIELHAVNLCKFFNDEIDTAQIENLNNVTLKHEGNLSKNQDCFYISPRVIQNDLKQNESNLKSSIFSPQLKQFSTPIEKFHKTGKLFELDRKILKNMVNWDVTFLTKDIQSTKHMVHFKVACFCVTETCSPLGISIRKKLTSMLTTSGN